MKSVPPEARFTYEHYLLTPEDKRYELIDGDLYRTPAPTPYHQIVSQRIAFALGFFVEERGLGQVIPAPCDVYFSEHDVVQPDILFIASEKLCIIKEKYIDGAPDLVIEILSPTSSVRDLKLKRPLYLRHGVREFWIVDPDAKRIQVLRRRQRKFETFQTFEAGDELETPLLPGFRLSLSRVFRR